MIRSKKLHQARLGGELEDAVHRSAPAAEVVSIVYDHLFTGPTRDIPLTKEETELLYFVVHEAFDYAGKARDVWRELDDLGRAACGRRALRSFRDLSWALDDSW